ncbi:TPM domain-containing protein [Actimicrobium sp. CCC2.4]|uniref:TPM domain-containing protein n=1 Tax=Actimicrobium sp. CCC2.4 TaxID=3048606 RepID=UPI002AC8E83C|nr:TPM domain-containing protein [Actimicrobium sp. CCC2.4]WPX31824.1 TPM domain-containing protein [Actimicrobium sp. CCC2.4]
MLSRLVRHLTTTAASGKRAFPVATLKAIENVIQHGERLHRAEVKLVIEAALPLFDVWSKVTARDRARELFIHYRVWDTEGNCGLLFYINLADHKVEIITDRAVGRALTPDEWRDICGLMTQGFRRGIFHDSMIGALTVLNHKLEQHFPDTGERRNQLPDAPLIL